MRGIVLAGGTGSRLGDVTKVVNKHCLLVHDRPMIMWPIKVLRDWGINDITIVSTPTGVDQIREVLEPGFNYRTQERPGGIVDAILQAERRFESQEVAIILGDNIFTHTPEQKTNCYFKWMPKKRLTQFGVPKFEDNDLVEFVEKPVYPPSNYALTGLYILPSSVFKVAKNIRPSGRGETEITDLLNVYLPHLSYSLVSGFWGDAGTFEGIYKCTKELRKCES